jgi:hypothetical protein
MNHQSMLTLIGGMIKACRLPSELLGAESRFDVGVIKSAVTSQIFG